MILAIKGDLESGLPVGVLHISNHASDAFLLLGFQTSEILC